MSVLKCANCGSTTNTAVSNWCNPIRKDRKANECYAKWNENRKHWEKGCTQAPDPIWQSFILGLIAESKLRPVKKKVR